MTTETKFIILIGNEPLKKSDAIILLAGDGYNRVRKAYQLYSEGWADLIVISGGTEDPSYGSFPASKMREELMRFGVPRKHVRLEEKSKNTREQAEEIIALAKEKDWKKLILVASHYHQFRAFLTFLKVIREQKLAIQIINSPARELRWFEKNEWGVRYELLDSEFEKIKKYRTLGHLCSYKEAIKYQKWKEKQE